MEAGARQALLPTAVRPGTLSAWVAVLGPPAVFLVDLAVSYALSHLSCATSRSWPTFLSPPIALLLVGVTVVFGHRSRRQLARDGSDAEAAHALLLALGTWSAVLFALGVVALAVPRFFLGPCLP